MTDTNEVDLPALREAIAKSLVDDFDANSDMAEKAALKVDTEHVEEYPDFDDLVEYVHDTDYFWED